MANKNDLIRLKDNDGVYVCPVSKSDGIFMPDGNTTLTKKITTIDEQLNTIEDQMKTDTIISSINDAINSGTSSLSTNKFDINNSGIIAKNGAITIKNEAERNVLYRDNDGNMRFVGVAELINTLSINGTEEIANILLRSKDGLECNISTGSGKSLNIFAPNGFYLGGSRVVLTDDDGTFRFWSTNGGAEKRIDTTPILGKIQAISLPLTLSSTTGRVQTDCNFYVNGACCPNVNFGDGQDLGTDALNWNTLYCKMVKTQNLAVSGSKNCVQETKNYGKRLINAYETADYYFGDIGESKIEGGEAIVFIDDIFKEIISSKDLYQVFITKYGTGDIWVEERNTDYFVVKSENDIRFGWEIKGKRNGWENNRLEEFVND